MGNFLVRFFRRFSYLDEMMTDDLALVRESAASRRIVRIKTRCLFRMRERIKIDWHFFPPADIYG